MQDNYAAILARTLKHEGGFSNHPNDPGGATMRGVIQTVYDGYRERKGSGRRSVRLIEESELQEIYGKQYWTPIRGDDLPSGIDLVVFDGAVNSGPSQSAKWLQRALGITADGNIGEGTLNACLQNGDHIWIINSICDQRLAFMNGLKNKKTGKPLWPDFGKGWNARVADMRVAACALAEKALPDPGATIPRPDIEIRVDPSPDTETAKAPPPVLEERKDAKKSKTVWATITGLLTSAAGAVWQAISNNPDKTVIVCLTILAVILLFIFRERLRQIAEEYV